MIPIISCVCFASQSREERAACSQFTVRRQCHTSPKATATA